MHESGDRHDSKASLPLIADCNGCGVCCFHMGYPAFLLPREPMSDAEIDADPELSRQCQSDLRRREELKAGHPGESYWHTLPAKLKAEWLAFVEGYETPDYQNDPATFDGPCLWLDLETRRCKNHLHRPAVCRDFETGSKQCHEWRVYYRDKILLNLPPAN